MIQWLIKIRLLLIFVLAVAGLVVFFMTPPTTQEIHLPIAPSPQNEVESFSDATAGGASSLHMAQDAQRILVQAVLDTAHRDAWAGVGWNVQNHNWSFVDSLRFTLRAQGVKKIMLKVLTFDPDHSVEGEKESYRQLEKEILVSDQWTTISLPAEYLYIPEWWYAQHQVPRDEDRKHLEDVRRLDLVISSEAPRGQPLALEVRMVQIYGGKATKFAMLMGYFFFLLVLVVGTNPNRRQKNV